MILTVDSNPLHNINIFREHDYRLKITFDECRLDERVA